ncbi:MAG TPA: M55 family metallopeptidase, partial [Spirochaetia bacterium]|nr:M55 family metallopeptidase [Spirochaetia bacterium]
GTASGVLNHTYVMRDVVEIRLNGKPEGEIGLNSYWAAYLGVPVIMVVGDDKVEAEAKTLVPEIEAAVVKVGISQFTARNLPLESARNLIRETAKRAVERIKEIPAIKIRDANEMEIDFTLSEIAHLCSYIPGVQRTGPRTVHYASKDYRDIQHVRILCTNLVLATIRAHF